jgi:hypothetical protein
VSLPLRKVWARGRCVSVPLCILKIFEGVQGDCVRQSEVVVKLWFGWYLFEATKLESSRQAISDQGGGRGVYGGRSRCGGVFSSFELETVTS